MDLQDELLRDWDDSDVEAQNEAEHGGGTQEIGNDTKSEQDHQKTEENDTLNNPSPQQNSHSDESLLESVRQLLTQRRQHDIQTKSITKEVTIFTFLPQLRQLLERFSGGSTDYMELLKSI